jgi:hypothetical protein
MQHTVNANHIQTDIGYTKLKNDKKIKIIKTA